MRIYALVRKQNAPFFWGAVGAIGGSLIGGLLSNQAAKHASDGLLSLGDQKALFDYQQNRLEAQQNSAHQREVADLRSAGLNPILSAGGSGAASGIAAPIDTAAYNSARTAANQQKIQSRLAVASGLQQVGEKLLDASIQKQNANSSEKQADAALMNAQTNASNSAADIALKGKQGEYFTALQKKTLDDILNNPYIRKNLEAQTAHNFASAHEIDYLLDPRKDLMEAQQFGTLSQAGMVVLNGAAKNFRSALTAGSKTAKGAKNSAKAVKNSGHSALDYIPRKGESKKDMWKRLGSEAAKADMYDINKVYGSW